MNKIDLHCDTIYRIYKEDKYINLYSNDFHVDLKKLVKSNTLGQFFALFIDMDEDTIKTKNHFQQCLAMLDKFYEEIEKNSDIIAVAKNYKEMNENEKQNKISAFLTIEEGGVIGDNLYNLRNLYRLGVRLITLTWNYPNYIGYPNYKKKYTDKGLTNFGKDFIKEMNNLGMIIDVSHLSDGGFYDVANISKQPFVASHSNARSIKKHSRNLTDDMIKILANKGGILGINFCSAFLGNGKMSRIDDIIKHIKHIRNIAGIDILALGSDFDGIGDNLEVKNAGETDKIIDSLNKNGFTSNDIEKIFYKNATRVIREIMK